MVSHSLQYYPPSPPWFSVSDSSAFTMSRMVISASPLEINLVISRGDIRSYFKVPDAGVSLGPRAQTLSRQLQPWPWGSAADHISN